jgi:hypothetical protein
MFSVADSAAASRTLSAARQFRSKLEACMAVPSGTTSPPASAVQGGAAGDETPIPVVCNGLQRQELGFVVRFAGELYPSAILLAAAQIARDRTMDALMLNAGDQCSRAAVLTRVNEDLALLNGVDVDGGMLPAPRAGSTAQKESDASAVYEREASAVLRGVDALLEAIDTMRLQNAWAETPPYGGRVLQEIFTKLPQQGLVYSGVSCRFVAAFPSTLRF